MGTLYPYFRNVGAKKLNVENLLIRSNETRWIDIISFTENA